MRVVTPGSAQPGLFRGIALRLYEESSTNHDEALRRDPPDWRYWPGQALRRRERGGTYAPRVAGQGPTLNRLELRQGLRPTALITRSVTNSDWRSKILLVEFCFVGGATRPRPSSGKIRSRPLMRDRMIRFLHGRKQGGGRFFPTAIYDLLLLSCRSYVFLRPVQSGWFAQAWRRAPERGTAGRPGRRIEGGGGGAGRGRQHFGGRWAAGYASLARGAPGQRLFAGRDDLMAWLRGPPMASTFLVRGPGRRKREALVAREGLRPSFESSVGPKRGNRPAPAGRKRPRFKGTFMWGTNAAGDLEPAAGAGSSPKAEWDETQKANPRFVVHVPLRPRTNVARGPSISTRNDLLRPAGRTWEENPDQGVPASIFYADRHFRRHPVGGGQPAAVCGFLLRGYLMAYSCTLRPCAPHRASSTIPRFRARATLRHHPPSSFAQDRPATSFRISVRRIKKSPMGRSALSRARPRGPGARAAIRPPAIGPAIAPPPRRAINGGLRPQRLPSPPHLKTLPAPQEDRQQPKTEPAQLRAPAAPRAGASQHTKPFGKTRFTPCTISVGKRMEKIRARARPWPRRPSGAIRSELRVEPIDCASPIGAFAAVSNASAPVPKGLYRK